MSTIKLVEPQAARATMPRVSSFLEPLRSAQVPLPKLLLLTVAEKPEKEFEHWLDITTDTQPIERVSGGLDGVYIEFQKEMLTPEGQAALRSLTERRVVGVWTRAGIHPDDLSTAQTLIHECGVTFVNTDLPRTFCYAQNPASPSRSNQTSPSSSRDRLPRISPASSRDRLPRISLSSSRDRLPRISPRPAATGCQG